MSPQTWILLLIPLAYVLGSVPFGLLVGRAKGIDVRKAGSGNIGATNVGRLLGKRFFFLVFFLDLLKSFIPMVIASAIVARVPQAERTWQLYLIWLMVGLAAVIGHMYSLFLGFKGGKGVATSTGFALGVMPYYFYPCLVCLALFIITFYAWRYISLASIVGAMAFPVVYVLMGRWMGWPVAGEQWPLLAFAVLIGVMIVYKHRSNIARLLAGTENRFGSPRPQPTPTETSPPRA
ncbi:MAG: glycerol-3-phosphate 1-O-acyltransferase PlsY [Tepidisphaeraceae bacterium]